ncbi:MAG TPA: tRNA (N(6)-L-threonylcarbamoyladenosine(37)-C(2))-methylthiotransferase MtaB [Terriglobales bacterium]|nr:tRNA (N(6)-L-threonylcarbamoyladenosine(37)-C(2))-methylthiotransferase MtaB [Terriglobales bacterium]
MSTFHVQNFGCRAAQADGAALERQLLEHGLHPADDAGAAEFVILNTCTVTGAADQDARSAIRRIHRENPECRILVTGCYAQRAPQELAALPGVAWVVGNSHKQDVAGIVAQTQEWRRSPNFIPVATLGRSPDHAIANGPMVLVGDIFAHTELLAAPVFEARTHSERTRPNLKVQDGCDNRCSFCVIPAVRGQSRSLRLADAVREVRALVEAGYREVVISGINLGRWGRDLEPPRRFEDLIEAILAETTLERLRLSSVEPMDWTERLIDLVAGESRIARHAHVPLQSGSDRVLRRMHRRYRPWHYAERIHRIRERMPLAAIGADVMVGFPGETDAEFEENRAFIASLPFTYLHVFTYSARPGTPAAAMPGQVRSEVARERNRVLRELAAEKNLAFRRQMVGRTIPAITLSAQDGDSTEALTDNYLKMRLAGRHEANQWMGVRVVGVTKDGLEGVCNL